MSIIKNAEDETERSLKNIKAVGFLVSFGCLRLKLLSHALTAHEKLFSFSALCPSVFVSLAGKANHHRISAPNDLAA